MNIEELLRGASADIAEDVVPPDVEPAAIRDRAQRRTRLRAATVGSALVAVAMVAALLVARPGDRDADPAPVPTPTPTPSPLRVDSVPVWGDRAGVHVGDRTYPVADGVRLETLAVTANGVVYGDRSGRIWFQPRRGDAVEIGRAVRRSLAAGPSSTKAVWVEPGQELVVFDTRLLEEVGRTAAPGGLQVDGQTNGDRVHNMGPFFHVSDALVIYSGSVGDVSAWTYRIDDQTFEPLARHDDAPAPGPMRFYIDHAPGVNARFVTDSPGSYAFFRSTITFADDAGRKISSFTHAEPSGTFNATGTRYVTVVDTSGGRNHVEVVDTGSGRSRRLTEDSRLYSLIAWGRGEIVMVWRFRLDGPSDDQLLACDVRRGTCRDLPNAGRPVVPNG